MQGHTRSRWILGMRVDATSYEAAAEAILVRARCGDGGYVCVATVHMVMEAWDDPGFRALVNGAWLVTPDGMPLVWGLRRLGIPDASRVYGPELTPRVCARAEAEGVPVGFYGGTPATLERMTAQLRRRFPRLEIACTIAPPFRPVSPEEERKAVDEIRACGARVLFVGLGCPKQERWMAARQDALPELVMLGVGAAFDFLAGTKRQAPPWMQSAGLEWLFRLATEPRRLWRRYARHNPRFAWHFARQLLDRPRDR
jgi:N-acetylglucosaminyldiphosphoundecaprenol N-acetyl-beta-D-mannosaminyltransferase